MSRSVFRVPFFSQTFKCLQSSTNSAFAGSIVRVRVDGAPTFVAGTGRKLGDPRGRVEESCPSWGLGFRV